jgi:hypothetical protein
MGFVPNYVAPVVVNAVNEIARSKVLEPSMTSVTDSAPPVVVNAYTE